MVNGAKAPTASTCPAANAAAAASVEQRLERDVLLGQPGLLQREQQQVVVDRALLDGDRLALEVGDAGDARPGDDLVVAGRVVVDQHDGLLGAAADRGEGVVEGLAVGVDVAGGQRGEAVGVAVEVLQLDLDAVLGEQALLLRDLPGEPARPGAEAERDRGLRARRAGSSSSRRRSRQASEHGSDGRRGASDDGS